MDSERINHFECSLNGVECRDCEGCCCEFCDNCLVYCNSCMMVDKSHFSEMNGKGDDEDDA